MTCRVRSVVLGGRERRGRRHPSAEHSRPARDETLQHGLTVGPPLTKIGWAFDLLTGSAVARKRILAGDDANSIAEYVSHVGPAEQRILQEARASSKA